MKFAGASHFAVLLAAVAGWLIGAVWYNVFAKPWQAAVGMAPQSMRMSQKSLGFYLPFIYAFLAQLVMAWVLGGVIGHLGPGQFTVRNGVISGAFCWLGFVITTMAVNNSFAGREPRLLAIDGGHWLAVLVAMGAILGAFGAR